MDYNARKYEPRDEVGILELLNLVFARGRDLKLWEWLYNRNPASEPLIWIVKDGGKVIGHRSYLPAKVKVGNNTLIAGQAIDTAVHPEYRRCGIFSKLLFESLQEAYSRNWAFIYNFPNQFAYPGYLKSGWSDAFKIRLLIKILSPLAVAKNALKIAVPFNIISDSLDNFYSRIFHSSKVSATKHGFSIKEDFFFDEYYDNFWERISKEYHIVVIRSSKYLNWRYAENPLFDYKTFSIRDGDKIIGYTILQCSTIRGFWCGNIVEFLTLPDMVDVAKDLLALATDFFIQQKCHLIICWMLDYLYQPIFKHNGFFINPAGKANFVVRPLSDEISLADLKKTRNWLLRLGDTDTH